MKPLRIDQRYCSGSSRFRHAAKAFTRGRETGQIDGNCENWGGGKKWAEIDAREYPARIADEYLRPGRTPALRSELIRVSFFEKKTNVIAGFRLL